MDAEHKITPAVAEYDNGYPKFEVDASVPAKYHGTAADARDMATLGKRQVLRVCAGIVVVSTGADGIPAQLQIRDHVGLREHSYG